MLRMTHDACYPANMVIYDRLHALYDLQVVQHLWLRTNGVNTNGTAAKVMIFGGLGKKVRPGTSGNIKVG